MASTDTAKLVAVLEADIRGFAKGMELAQKQFDQRANAIEARGKQLTSRLSKAFDFSGVGRSLGALAIPGFGAAGAILSVAGLTAFASKVANAATALKDLKIETGFSTDRIQELQYAATQSGSDIATLNDALEKFNKNLGEAKNTGTGAAADAFRKLGIAARINAGELRSNEDIFNATIDALGKIEDGAQRTAYQVDIFGKTAGVKLSGLIAEGTKGLAGFADEAHRVGAVLSEDAIKKIDTFKDQLDALNLVIQATSAEKLSGLVQGITDIINALRTGGWQEALNALSGGLAHLFDSRYGTNNLANMVVRRTDELAKANKDLADAQKAASADAGLPGAHISGTPSKITGLQKGVALAYTNLYRAQRDLLLNTPMSPTGTGAPGGKPPPGHIGDPSGDKAAAALAAQRAAALAQTRVDLASANVAMVAAQDSLNTQLAEGTADYYAAVMKEIDDARDAKIAAIDEEESKQLQSLDKLGKNWADYEEARGNITKSAADKRAQAEAEAKQKAYENSSEKLTKDALADGDRRIQQYEDETKAIGLLEPELAALHYIQDQLNAANAKGIELTDKEIDAIYRKADAIRKAAKENVDAQKASDREIAMMDALRQGFEDIGVAALDGSKSFKQAVGQMLKDIAILILRLYVLKPLIEAVFGPQGGGGGGILGSILGPIFGGGKASGGPVSAGRVYRINENGQEFFAPSVNGTIIPNSAGMPRSGGGGVSVAFSIDARGAAADTDIRIESAIRRSIPQIVTAAVKQNDLKFPVNFQRLARDKL